jgi:hypothetical protein
MKQVPENQDQNEIYAFNFFKSLRDTVGVICNRCNHTDVPYIPQERVYRCKCCHHRMSVKSGTVMQSSRLGYSVWLEAFKLISLMKKSTSSVEMMKHLGVKSYRTALMLMHKIRHVMSKAEVERITNQLDQYNRIRCRLTIRQSRKKKKSSTKVRTLMVRNERGEDNHFQISWISVEDFNKWKPARNAVNGLSRSHPWKDTVIKQSEMLKKSDVKPWILRHLSNLEKNLKGIHHGVSEKYRQLYLDEFSYRTNLSMAGIDMFENLVTNALREVWWK